MTHSTFVDYLRSACTAALLASQAHAQTRGGVAFAPGGTTCTSRVARPFGTLPGENIIRPASPLELSQPRSDALGGLGITWGELNAAALPIISSGGKGHSAKGNVIRGGLHAGRSTHAGYTANRKAPDVAGRAVRRLK